MPTKLPLYEGGQAPCSAIEQASPRILSKGCKACELWRGCATVCMGGDGKPGGLLVVGDYPGRNEDDTGRPWSGAAGQFVRALVTKHWTGPVVYDAGAIRCAPGGAVDKLLLKSVTACRPHLVTVLQDARPTRILAMGSYAIAALTGRSMPPLSVRRGYTWTKVNGQETPVYLLPNPAGVSRNRFLRAGLERDLLWALTSELPFKPQWGAVAWVV